VPVAEHTIYLDQSPVYYRTADGPGGPALGLDAPPVYLHGIPTSSDDWVDFLARTGGIAPDMLGFGRSGKGVHLDFSVDGLATFLERFLDEVVEVDAVRLVGHDLGAAVALTFARRHPQRVRRLVLCNAPPLLGGFEWPPVARRWRTPVIGEGVMGATTRRVLIRALRRGCVRADAWSPARLAAVWNQFDQGTQRAILRLVRSARENMLGGSGAAGPQGDGGSVGAGEPREGGGSVGAGEPREGGGSVGAGEPTGGTGGALIVWGDRDPWYPPALADAYASVLPGSRVERFEDAGHWPWLDRADVVDRVAAFLEE
jgi:pimeloyl-ACP methyl ester carboxylesterase